MTQRFRPFRSNETGATLIEFAMLGPVIIMMLIGVVQVAALTQSYNALRSVAADTARYAIVEYQKQNSVTDTTVEDFAEMLGTGPRYQLTSNLSASVANATNQRVDGATEKTLTVTYTPPAIMPIVDWVSPTLTYSRPIFLIDE